jgi:hypothetical protein
MGVADLTSFAQALDVRETARLRFEPTRSGVISWNTLADVGRLRFRLLRALTPASAWYNFAEWHPSGRKSFNVGSDSDGVSVDVDVVNAQSPFDGIELSGEGIDFSVLAFASPLRSIASPPFVGESVVLDVPAYSQYVVEGERGWCSPASLAMVNAYHGVVRPVDETARAVLDRAYNGTGNWTFNTAFSGSLGLRAVVAYLQNLDHARRLIERNLPVVVSYSWRNGELPGAPLAHSDGHLAVLCGFTTDGDCVMNDPAAPGVRVVYPRGALESIWQRNNGVAYVIAPPGVEYSTILAATA